MDPDELSVLAQASKLLWRAEYRPDASRLNAIITMEGGDVSKLLAPALDEWRRKNVKPGEPDPRLG